MDSGHSRKLLVCIADQAGNAAKHADRGAWHGALDRQRKTRTGIPECVSTFTVSLPSTIAATPRRPCEAIMIRSQPCVWAVSMIP